jgi:ABC-type transporter Mla subunit MlaD
MYIDMHPGTPAKPMLDGPIPASHTSNQVELDQVLEAYSGDTAQQQRNLFKGLKDTLSDPKGTGKTLDTLSPTLTTISKGLTPVLGQQTDDLGRLAVAAGKTVHGLDDTMSLQSLVTSADQTFAVTDARSKQLGQTLQLSPASLQSTFTTMARLRTTLGHLDPLVAKLRPGARELGPAAAAAAPALHKTQAVLNQLDPLLKQAGPTFVSLHKASPEGVSLMNGLDPTVTRLLNDIFPWLRKADPGTRLATYEMIGPFWSDLAMDAGEYDSVGYRIRFTVPPGSNSFISSPVATQMTTTCTHSGLKAALCSKAVGMLANGLFGTKIGGKR